MRLIDFLQVIIILLIFVGIFAFNIMSIGIKNIQKNWPVYRCNPMIIPFANMFGYNVGDNFTYCIQNMQTNYMGYLMEPVNYSLSVVNASAGEVTQSVQYIRDMFNKVRTFASSIIKNIFSVFLNIIVEIQAIMIKLKDIISKLVGVIATLIFTLDGSIKTMKSINAGPPGETLRTIASLCFHPKTKLKMKNGEIKTIKSIALGDILENGSIVRATLKIKNYTPEDGRYRPLYRIPCRKLKTCIYVTGSHLIQHPKTGKFIPVAEFEEATVTNVQSEKLSCLVTDDHLITIGEYIFWDWEDNDEGLVE